MKRRASRVISWRLWVVMPIIAAFIVAVVWFGLHSRKSTPKEINTSKPACGVHCGTERWAVKTLSDDQASCVDFTPRQTTVSWLVSQKPPERLPEQSRSGTVECQVWELTGRLEGFKAEDDGDYHIVVADLDSNATMIVEIPDPSCSGACASTQEPDIERARESFIRAFGAPPQKYHRVSETVTVTVTGVGFFDFKHRQTGLAPNGVELHPVIGFTVDASRP